MERLDEKGFIFLDTVPRPFLCRMWKGEPWLFYRINKKWVSLRKVTQTDVWLFPRNLSDEQQDLYRVRDEN